MSTHLFDPARTALEASVSGPVLFAGDPQIDVELAGFNLAARHSPQVVVGATSAADVAAAVRYATRRGLAVGVHATGHGAAASEGTVIVSTQRMQRCVVHPGPATAVVQAGVIWSTVIDAAAAHGLAPLNGSSSAVGAVGYTLGGGAGPMLRRYGFAADHVVSFEIVTADGQIRRVDADRDPDLFWAARGGKGNFGIVTELEIGLVPVASLYAGALYYAGESAAEVLHAWREWLPALDEHTTTSMALLRLPDLPGVPAPLRGTVSVHLRFAHVGDTDSGQRLIEPMRRVAPTLIDTVRWMPYGEVDSIHNDPTDPLPAWSRGTFLRELPPAAVDVVLAHAGPANQSPLLMVELRHLGGAAAHQPSPGNAVGGRDAGFMVGAVGPVPPPLAQIVPAAGHALLDALAPWSTGQEPVNFAGAPRVGTDPGRGWAPATYARLLEVKGSYDPDNVFRTGYALVSERAS